MRISNNYYIEATFHNSNEFSQLLIFIYEDLFSELKIPGLFILINGKFQKYYDIIFSSVINIITRENKYELNIHTIVLMRKKL